ncbi:hypothetical protein Pmi06nite_65780 [Planotetraspora mira]|uniref:Uncharacterized protein n=1 Tax=Planotetraspora mira TaxID=58121 RepID=A0A8J3TW41_9ACTN|nr:hypothetical protein Pmi06nite_65780 [Planotetraspora mira]
MPGRYGSRDRAFTGDRNHGETNPNYGETQKGRPGSPGAPFPDTCPEREVRGTARVGQVRLGAVSAVSPASTSGSGSRPGVLRFSFLIKKVNTP